MLRLLAKQYIIEPRCRAQQGIVDWFGVTALTVSLYFIKYRMGKFSIRGPVAAMAANLIHTLLNPTWRYSVESTERKLLEELAPKHPELQALWQDHILFEKQLEKLESKPYRTPEEELQVREIKKQKLDGKTKMVELVNAYAKKDG